jgi:hypothetical protein
LSGLPEFTQRPPRRFQGDDDPQALPIVPREKRSLWLGVSVAGSRTTDRHEDFDVEAPDDVALATNL